MSVDVSVEILEDELWCDTHAAWHRVVFWSQPLTHEGINLGSGRIYEECLDDMDDS